MNPDRPLILLTNDDGYQAHGIRALRDALSAFAEVVLVAPETEQSASSHSLSLHRPLRLRRIEDEVYAVDGTPADCVYVALRSSARLIERTPDLVVSGLNHGLNLGSDVFYSGTVGAAREGALRGIPALATSADNRADRGAAAALVAEIARGMLRMSRPTGRRAALYNLNVPPGPGPWPVRTTVLGMRVYSNDVVVSRDPRGREYMWIGGQTVSHPEAGGSDTEAFDAGFASLTPLALDLTAFDQASEAAAVVAALPHVERRHE